MEILDTLVNREITLIGSAPQKPIAHQWKLIIKANGQEITPSYVKELKLDRLYHRNYGDELRVTVGINFADYQYNVLPYKDKLEATLTKIPMGSSVEPDVTYNRSRLTNTYKIQLQNANSSAIAGDHPMTLSKEMAGKTEIIDVVLQLFNPVIDTIRKRTFGTVFRDTAPLDAIAYVLVKHAKIEGSVQSNSILGINIDPTFDKEPRKHIIVPHNTSVVEIPDVIDKQVGGVHPAQMRYYLQSQYWYIYPIFDHQRFNQNVRSLTIIKIPKHRLPSVEKTYRISGEHVILLTTRETTHQDSSESLQMNEGNGIRFADSNRVMNGYYNVEDNKATAAGKDNISEVVYEPRGDESDMITAANTRITDKYNKEYANLARKSGSYIQTIWEHGDVDLLFPGMPVRYIFQDGEITRELYGTLNAAETLDYNTNNTITNPRFASMILLTCFLSRLSPMRKDATGTTISKTTTT